MAGLSAAFELEKAGVKYIVIEGAARVGGRVYPVEYEDGFLQYGATYINGDKNPIYEIAEANGLVDMNATNAADDYVPIYTEEEVIEGCDVREFTAFTESFVAKYKEYARHGRAMETFIHEFDRDYQAFLKHKNRDSRRSHFDHLARMYVTDMETEWAALMNKYALSNYEHDQYDDMTEFTLNKEGFNKILEVIKNRVPTDKIHFEQEVKNIDYSNKESVTLTTNKEKLECSSAIVTVSLGYLKKHSPTLFTPKLPEMKANVIRELGFGNMQKLFLIYDQPWLEKSAYHTMGPAASPVFGRGLTFDVTPWSRRAVQFWFSGPAVELIGQMSDEKLIEEMTTHLRKTLKNTTVPTAKSVVRHMWYQDLLVLGSYSYLTPGAVALKDPIQKLAEPILGNNGKPLVQFAGEATHSTIYQTTIGAFLSGQREARRLLPSEMSKRNFIQSGHISYIDAV